MPSHSDIPLLPSLFSSFRHGQDPPSKWERSLHWPHLRRQGHPQERRRGGLLPRYVFSSIPPSFPPSLPHTICVLDDKSCHRPPLLTRPSFPPSLPRSLFLGLGANLAGVTPEKAIKLAANDLLREALELPDGTLPLHREMMAGAGMKGGREGGSEEGHSMRRKN